MQIADNLLIEGTLTATGTITGGGGETVNVVTVAAAGATQGTATAIPVTAAVVNVTTTASTEGVKLPTAATGRIVSLVPPLTKGVKAYAAAAGQVINSATTATTAFAISSGLSVQFTALDATHWRAQPSNPGTYTTLTASGLTTLSGGLTVSGAQKELTTTVAAAGATQGTATAIAAGAATVVATVTASTEGVKLPTAATGRVINLIPPNTIGLKVYGGAAGQLINAATTATTAYLVSSGKPVIFYAVDATHWRVTSPSSIVGTTLAATGLATLSGGGTYSGAQKELTTIVAAAGATQGTATAIAASAANVVTTVTASTEGVKLPTAATGRVVTIIPPNTIGHKVYGGAAGQLINAGTTNTTAYLVSSGKPVTFYAVDATHWRVNSPSSWVASSLSVSGASTLTGGATITQTYKQGFATVATAGVTQGGATALASTVVLVNVSNVTSSGGVKLPTAATGRTITILADNAHSFKVYANAAGQSINAGTTATTAVVVATAKTAIFYAVSTTKWKTRIA